MQVLVTRPARPAARTAERLRAAGYTVICDPLLELHFQPPEVLLPTSTVDGVIFTSSNGVRALARHPELPRLTPLKLWTVGSRTTAAAKELGFQDLQAEALDLAGLAEVLAALPEPPLHLVHFAGADRAGDLAAMVRPLGPRIDTVVVYKADQAATFSDATAAALRHGSVDAVLHYSRRTAESYLALVARAQLPLGTAVQHICLSEAVAEPLRLVGCNVHVATLPTEDALLACLARANPPRQAAECTLETSKASTARMSMADPENPRSETEGAAKRSMKPRSAILDLKAQEVAPTSSEPLEVATPGIDTAPSEATDIPARSSEAAKSSGAASTSGAHTSETVAGEPAAIEGSDLGTSPQESYEASKSPVMSDSEPRSSLGALVGAGLAGAVIAIVIFLVLVSAELIPLGGAGNPALASRVAGVEREVQALSQRTQAAPSVSQETPAQVQELSAAVQALREQVQAQTSAAPPPAPDAEPALAALEQRITELSQRLDATATAANPAEDKEALARLSSRVEELATGVAAARQPDPAVSQAVEQASQAASAAQQATDAVGKSTSDAAKALDAANRAAVLASAASLESAIARGTPYRGALLNVQDHLPQAAVQTLEAGADKGLPTLDAVANQLREALEAAPRPEPVSTGLVDRFVEGARSMVRVRPADGSNREIVGDDAWAIRSRVVAKLDRRAYADALAEWETLDAGAKTASQSQADALKSRLSVDQALDGVRAQALAGAEGQP